MMYWIFDHPTWVMAILFVAGFVGVTWFGIFLCRMTVHSWIHQEERANEMVGFTVSNFFVLFGLLLGLLAVATYQNYLNVSNTVDQEASVIAALYRDFSAYPQPTRGQLQDRLREYIRFTLEDSWPRQRKGIVPAGEFEHINSLFSILSAFEPTKESEKIFYAETLRELDRLVELSQARMGNVALGLPSVFWWVVGFGAVMSIVLIWTLDMEIHVHLLLGGILAAILGALIFLIAMLENPFRGEVAVSPDSIALVYESLMKPDAVQSPPETPLRR
jgi:hypothetical protein